MIRFLEARAHITHLIEALQAAGAQEVVYKSSMDFLMATDVARSCKHGQEQASTTNPIVISKQGSVVVFCPSCWKIGIVRDNLIDWEQDTPYRLPASVRGGSTAGQSPRGLAPGS
jgi:hypothetical protein